MRVDATLDFEFKVHFEGHKGQMGSKLGFRVINQLLVELLKSKVVQIWYKCSLGPPISEKHDSHVEKQDGRHFFKMAPI